MTFLLKRVCEGDGDRPNGPGNPWPFQGFLNNAVMQHTILLLVAVITFTALSQVSGYSDSLTKLL